MPTRAIIYGNSGSGKSTMARHLAAETGAAVLSLDDVAWAEATVRRPLDESQRAVLAFIAGHADWIVEGCYGDLIETALPHCGELRFLNPGTSECIARCRGRGWEPDKFPTKAAQDAVLPGLIEWVATYETRNDEFGLRRHRAIFDGFAGPKREYP